MGPGDAKGYLQRLRALDTAINQKQAELSDIRQRLRETGGMDHAGERGGRDAVFVGMAAKVIDLEQEIDRDIDQMTVQRHKMIQQIQQTEDHRYMDILYKRYVQYKRFDIIAKEMQYSFPHTMRLHEMALKDFAFRVKEDTQ